MTDLRIFPDIDRLGSAWTQALAERIRNAVRSRGSCSLVLTGGRSPEPLYERLARAHCDDVPWPDVQVFWGDERYVPADHEASNYGMANAALLRSVPLAADHIHRMPTEPLDPDAAAAAYEQVLRSRFDGPWPVFDIVLLGLGEDCHTASLFPGSPALEVEDRWVVAATGPSEPRTRITLTWPAIVHARAIDIIVTGQSKAAALRRAVMGPIDRVRCPASALRSAQAEQVWWADAAAATLLSES
jgi:6-phosphogluconolactonase